MATEKSDTNGADPSAPHMEVADGDEEPLPKGNEYMQAFARIRDAPFVYLASRPRLMQLATYGLLFALYNAYFIGCLVRYIKYDYLDWEWCDGFGFLVIITAIAYTGLAYYKLIKPWIGDAFYRQVVAPFSKAVDRVFDNSLICGLGYLAVVAAIATFVVIDSWESPDRLMSGVGVVSILTFGFVFSAHPGYVRWRHVVWGIGIEFCLGLAVLRWEFGREVFQCLGDKVSTFLAYTDEGSGFVYGYLVTGLNIGEQQVASGIFFFWTLSVIFFFSFVVNMLFYVGALQWIVSKMGWLLYSTMGTTAAESLNAAANIFLGHTEAPLLIKPFLPVMTKSEIHAVMTGGFATIAGTVLAAFINLGIDAASIISASVMAAPAALAFSKLFYPETERSKTKVEDIQLPKGEGVNIIDAAAQGASQAIILVLNIAANLIAFYAFIAFLDGIIGYLATLAGVVIMEDDIQVPLTLEYIFGKVFIPLAFVMGVPLEDCETVARLIGKKTLINELAAYEDLGQLVEAGKIGERAELIATFALCGFANSGSIGTQLGGLGALAPDRKADFAKVVLRAFVAGSFASFLNASVAGMLITAST